jgi:DNA polymerase I-like protein with 3'-5' exonuclease and polymerase domains
VDTETTGLGFTDRAVGMSIWTPDDKVNLYIAWGHGGGDPKMNNVSKAEFTAWAEAELTRKNQTKVWHNAPFDMRMMAYDNVAGLATDHHAFGRVEDTGVLAFLLNDLEPQAIVDGENLGKYSLDALGYKYCGLRKREDVMIEKLQLLFGGRKTKKAQMKNLHRAPWTLVDEYARHDAVNTGRLYEVLRPRIEERGMGPLYEIETQLIPLLLRMHMAGVRVDLDRAQELKEKFEAEYYGVLDKWKTETDDANYNSAPQIAKMWEAKNLGPYPRTEKKNPSFTKEWLSIQAEGGNELAAWITELRHLERYSGTFLDSYIFNQVQADGLLHCDFNATLGDHGGAVSGRFSSSNPNLQNIPSRDAYAKLIRGLFIPMTPDHDWAKGDYSQIEFRFLAHYAAKLGYRKLADAYHADDSADFHQIAAEIVGQKRSDAKHQNFGMVYGMGPKLLALKLGKTLEEARPIFADYHDRLPDVRATYDLAERKAARRGYVVTYMGRERHFPRGYFQWDPDEGKRTFVHDERSKRHGFTHKALNAVLQGSAADLIKAAMVRIDKVVDWEEVIVHLTVHDELDFSVTRSEKAKGIMGEIRETMEDFELEVPVKFDLDMGNDWGHADLDFTDWRTL